MEAGNELCKQLADVEGFTLRFGQLGHFDGAVIFAGLHPEEKEGGNHLTQLSACLMDGCRAANIHLIDDRFHPHVTLLKLSKDPQLRRQVQLIFSYINHYQGTIFFNCLISFRA